MPLANSITGRHCIPVNFFSILQNKVTFIPPENNSGNIVKPKFSKMLTKFTPRMMKSFFLFCCCCMCGMPLFAQNYLFSGFENAPVPAPPPGWVVENTSHAKWQSLKNTEYGGNALNGVKCMYLANSFFGDQSDAWLITPAFNMEAGKRYSISFYYKNQVFQSNTLEVRMGNAQQSSAQTELLWKQKFSTDYYTKAQINYKATETGTKYFAIHCTSPVTYTYIYIDNFLAKEVNTFESPDLDVTDITTTTATASWKRIGMAKKYLYGYNDKPEPPANPSTTTETSAPLTGLQPATRYYLYVKTIDKNGNYSSWAMKEFSSAYDVANIESLNCGEKTFKQFRANQGLYMNIICNQPYFGMENFHKFTPSVSGYYNFNVLAVNTGQTMEFAYKEASQGAGPDGWTCIGSEYGDFGGKATFGPLEAGKEYLILEKAMAAPGFPSSYYFQVECYNPPPANDNCDAPLEMFPVPYNDTAKGVRINTLGATNLNMSDYPDLCGYSSGDDDVWLKFTATSDMQLFRFTNMKYKNYAFAHSNPGMYIDILESCNLKKSVDCGYFPVDPGVTKDIFTYKVKKGKTYYVRLFTADQFTYANFKLSMMDLDIAKGKGNSCTPISPYSIDKYTDGDNRSRWVPQTDEAYKLISEINANGNKLNMVQGGLYRHSGALRQDKNGVYYLDRTITLDPGKQPNTPVQVRIIIPNDELQKLIDKPGSGVSSIKDIRVSQNNDNCATEFTKHATAFITPSFAGKYDDNNMMISFEATYLSTFYLHGGDKALVAKPGLAGKTNSSPEYAKQVDVYPNPFKDHFTVVINEDMDCQYSLLLTDMQGHSLQSIQKEISKGTNTISINAANLAPGMYILKIQKPNGIEYRKLVKL